MNIGTVYLLFCLFVACVNGAHHDNAPVKYDPAVPLGWECFSDQDCSDRQYPPNPNIVAIAPFCYLGRCSDRCPPGYSKTNVTAEVLDRIANNQTLTQGVPVGADYVSCNACNTEEGFEENGFFDYPFDETPKCKCTQNYCIVRVMTGLNGFVHGLVPKGAPPNCKKVTVQTEPEQSSDLQKFITYWLTISMVLMALAACRSCSCVTFDFARHLTIYIWASLSLQVFVNDVVPFNVGFTRSMGFGIILHNSSEWMLINRLYFGKSHGARTWSVTWLLGYYMVMVLLMAILPVNQFFFFAMLQGGFCDWTLLLTSIPACKTVGEEKQDRNWGFCPPKSRRRLMVTYFLGALFHILTIEIAFAGFALNQSALIGLGTVMQIPMFTFYLAWTFGQTGNLLCFGPSAQVNYNESYYKGKDEESLLVPISTTTQGGRMFRAFNHTIGGSSLTSSQAATVEMQAVGGDVEVEQTLMKQNTDDRTCCGRLLNPTQGQDIPPSSLKINDHEFFKLGLTATNKCWYVYLILAFVIMLPNSIFFYTLPLHVDTSECQPGFSPGTWLAVDLPGGKFPGA